MFDGSPVDLAGAVAVCVAGPVPAGLGELTWTLRWQAAIDRPAARMTTGRAKLDFMSGPIESIGGGLRLRSLRRPENGMAKSGAGRGKQNGSPGGCRRPEDRTKNGSQWAAV